MSKTVKAPDKYKSLVAEKEEEWYKAYQMRVKALEETLEEKNSRLESVEKKYTKLRESFKYNIQLISQRDKELDRLEILVKDLGAKLNVANAELSESKIREDECHRQLSEFNKSLDDIRMHFKERLEEKQAEIDEYRMGKQSKLDGERKECEEMKRKLSSQLLKAEESFELHKRELAISFDDALKKKEHEFRMQRDEMQNALKAEQIKVKISTKELELVKTNQKDMENSLGLIEENQGLLEKTLKQKEWEIKDLNANHEARQAELEAHLSAIGRAKDKMQEDFLRKYNELDRSHRQKDCEIEKLRSALLDQEKSRIVAINDLQLEKQAKESELSDLKTRLDEKEQTKEAELKRLMKELEKSYNEIEIHRKNSSDSFVRQELELQSMKEERLKMNLHIQELKHTVERYQKDLDAAMRRESDLEKSKSQIYLDFQKRLESDEREEMKKSESLIQKLTKSRDEALATVKEQQRKMEEQTILLQKIELEKNNAYKILSVYDIEIPEENKGPLPSFLNPEEKTELESLRNQNENLRLVIKEMRQQISEIETRENRPLDPENMETVMHSNERKTPSISEDYVRSLENSLKEIKKENRLIKLKLVDLDKGQGSTENTPNFSDNALIQVHIQALNQELGELKKEKTEMLAHARKQQVRLSFLEENLKTLREQEMQLREARTAADEYHRANLENNIEITTLRNEPQKKEVALEQMKYELNVNAQRFRAEISSLTKRNAEQEMQLREARTAADEYHRANLENNIEITTLRNEVASLKLELSENQPTINFGAQELTIHQLQDEILNLRQRGATLGKPDPESTHQMSSNEADSNALVNKLQAKLTDAVKRIVTISQDRQRLIDHSNRLQSELNKVKMNSDLTPLPKATASNNGPPHALGPSHTSRGGDETITGRFTKLEDLHYQLTRQELEYAQKYQNMNLKFSPRNDLPVRDKTPLDSDSPQSMTDDDIHLAQASLLRASSEGGQSLIEVWNLLEDKSTISSVTSGPPKEISVERSERSEKTKINPGCLKLKGKNQPKKVSKVKIRNYNFKDDAMIS